MPKASPPRGPRSWARERDRWDPRSRQNAPSHIPAMTLPSPPRGPRVWGRYDHWEPRRERPNAPAYVRRPPPYRATEVRALETPLEPGQRFVSPMVQFKVRSSFDGIDCPEFSQYDQSGEVMAEKVLKLVLRDRDHCVRQAAFKRVYCFLTSMEAKVDAYLEPEWASRRLATFQLVHGQGIDFDMVSSLATFLRHFNDGSNVITLQVHVSPRYSSIPRRPDGANLKQTSDLCKQFETFFSCNEVTCTNHRGFCIRFQGKHYRVNRREIREWAEPHVREDKTMTTTILELIAKRLEKESEEQPGRFEKDDLASALLSMPFLIQCLPSNKPGAGPRQQSTVGHRRGNLRGLNQPSRSLFDRITPRD